MTKSIQEVCFTGKKSSAFQLLSDLKLLHYTYSGTALLGREMSLFLKLLITCCISKVVGLLHSPSWHGAELGTEIGTTTEVCCGK